MAKKKVTVEVDDKVTAALIETLKQYPAVETVWLNDAGEWHFHERPGFVAFSAREILGIPADVPAPPAEPAKEETEDSKPE